MNSQPLVRWTTLSLVVATLGGGLMVASCTRTEPQAQKEGTPAVPAAMTPEQQLARGEYLVTIEGCGDCHTPGTLYGAPDMARQLAGSELGWQGPWGVSYARNLTPDPQTGLGTWSEDQIVSTLKTGKRADGSPLLPPMPWPNTARMTDEDLHAVAVYLKSLPPVEHQVPAVIPPGKPVSGSVIVIPPPSAWDAPRQAAAPANP
jgi:mono/diheme cytochrome c family protein